MTGFGLWDLPLILFGLRSSARSGSSAPKSSAASRSSLPRAAFTGVRGNGSGSSAPCSTTIPFTPFNHSLPVVASLTFNACITSSASLVQEVDRSKIDAALESGDGSRLLSIRLRLNGNVGIIAISMRCLHKIRYVLGDTRVFSLNDGGEISTQCGPGKGKGRTTVQSENGHLKNSRGNTVVFIASF